MSYFMRVGNMKWDELWGETYSVVPQGKFAGKKSAAHSRSRNNDNYPEDKRQITLSSRTGGSRPADNNTMTDSVTKEQA